MKRSHIPKFLRRITSSDEIGYWRSLHRAKKLELEHWSSRIGEHCEQKQSSLMESRV